MICIKHTNTHKHIYLGCGRDVSTVVLRMCVLCHLAADSFSGIRQRVECCGAKRLISLCECVNVCVHA